MPASKAKRQLSRMSPLTTVAQDAEAMANAAFHRVLNRLSGKEVDNREIALNPELIVRTSTGPAR
jgi:DNA-binding LacI/PurR family transcriptional regulator